MAISGTMGKFVRLVPISAIVCLLLSYTIAFLIDIPLSRFLLGNLKTQTQKSRIDRLTETASEKFRQWSLAVTVRNRDTARFWSLSAIKAILLS
jgi:multidrug efflux pump subunit AcrB